MSDTGSIAIIGGGALGLIYAGLAAQREKASGPVLLVSRQQELLQAKGFTVRFLPDAAHPEQSDGTFEPETVRVARLDELSEMFGRCRIAILLARSDDSDYAVDCAGRLLAADGIAVTLQNGLSGWLQLRQSGIRYVAGACFTGAHRIRPDLAVCSRRGRVALAADNANEGAAASVAAFFESCGIAATVERNEATVVWRKVLMTTVNWVCASLGAPVCDVVARPDARALFLDLMREIVPVAAGDGARIVWREQESEVDLFLAEATVAHGSAYSALSHGQTLEIDEICGSVIARAAAAGIAVPRAELLLRLFRIQSSVFMKERERWGKR